MASSIASVSDESHLILCPSLGWLCTYVANQVLVGTWLGSCAESQQSIRRHAKKTTSPRIEGQQTQRPETCIEWFHFHRFSVRGWSQAKFFLFLPYPVPGLEEGRRLQVTSDEGLTVSTPSLWQQSIKEKTLLDCHKYISSALQMKELF